MCIYSKSVFLSYECAAIIQVLFAHFPMILIMVLLFVAPVCIMWDICWITVDFEGFLCNKQTDDDDVMLSHSALGSAVACPRLLNKCACFAFLIQFNSAIMSQE